MDLKNIKFIIISGCSYDRFARSFKAPLVDGTLVNFSSVSEYERVFYETYPQFEPLKHICKFQSDDVIMISLGVGGFSNKWVSESLIYFCNFLLSQGVKVQDLYVLASFTDFHRRAIDYTQENFNFKFPKNKLDAITPPLTYSSSTNSKVIGERLANTSPVAGLKYYTGVGKIGDSLKITPVVTLTSSKHNSVDEESQYLKEVSRLNSKIVTNGTTADKVLGSIQNINKLGTYLESKGIDYNFCSMYSIFNFYPSLKENPTADPIGMNSRLTFYRYAGEKKTWIKTAKDKESLNIKGTELSTNIPEFKEQIESTYKYNWTFYEKGEIKLGGIDEFVLHNFGTAGYASTSRTLLDLSLPRPKNHPLGILYPVIFNYFATNCKFLEVNKGYIESAAKYLEFFHNKKGFDFNKPIDYPVLTSGLFKDEISEFTEIRKL